MLNSYSENSQESNRQVPLADSVLGWKVKGKLDLKDVVPGFLRLFVHPKPLRILNDSEEHNQLPVSISSSISLLDDWIYFIISFHWLELSTSPATLSWDWRLSSELSIKRENKRNINILIYSNL